jgi:surfactin synthase thioesterase subunit
MSKSVLYYFPYAGASSVTFNPWKKFFVPEIEFVTIDYAGHGKRRGERFYESVKEACSDIYSIIKNDVQNYDYFYFGGHCIGAIIAFEMYYYIKEKNEIKLPDAIFLSGQGAPHLAKSENLSLMDNDELLMHLYNNKSISSDMLDKEIYEYVGNFVLTPVKADSKIFEDYKYEPKNDLIESSLYILYGNKDILYQYEDFKAWDEFTNKLVKYYCFDGGHYFINSESEQYIKNIKYEIAEYEKNNKKSI